MLKIRKNVLVLTVVILFVLEFPAQKSNHSAENSRGRACPHSDAYLALIDTGVYPCLNATGDHFCPVPELKSQFIEVFAPDMLSFPILDAHIQLHQDPNAQ